MISVDILCDQTTVLTGTAIHFKFNSSAYSQIQIDYGDGDKPLLPNCSSFSISKIYNTSAGNATNGIYSAIFSVVNLSIKRIIQIIGKISKNVQIIKIHFKKQFI